MYNESAKKATYRYRDANMAQVNFRVKKEDKERYKEAAKAADMSLEAFIKEAIDEKIGRMKNGKQRSKRKTEEYPPHRATAGYPKQENDD